MLLALALAAPADAQTVTFGADLNRPVAGGFDCTVAPTPIGLAPTGAQSCTWASIGPLESPQEGLVVPNGTGLITAVRVKVGPVTGPMRVVVLEAYRGATTGCCTGIRASQAFTPAANAVTTVPMNPPLQVSADPVGDPNTLTIVYDVLGLSVLAPGVPVPLTNAGSAFGFFPDVKPGAPVLGAGEPGWMVLMNADWQPVSANPTPQAGPVTGTATGTVPNAGNTVPGAGPLTTAPNAVVPARLAGLAATRLAQILRAGALGVNATAPGPGTFDLGAFLDRVTARRFGIAAVKRVRIGTGKATAKKAGPVTVKVRLTRSAKRRLKRARSLRLSLIGTFTGADGKKTNVSSAVTLRR